VEPGPTPFGTDEEPYSVAFTEIPWKKRNAKKVIWRGEVFADSNVPQLAETKKNQSYIFGGGEIGEQRH
jgi:hypothetical protein